MCVWTMQISSTGGKKGGPHRVSPLRWKQAITARKWKKHQIAISSSKGINVPSQDTPCFESESFYREGSNRHNGEQTFTSRYFCLRVPGKDFLHLLQGHICVFQTLGPLGAPGDQHPTVLRVQDC